MTHTLQETLHAPAERHDDGRVAELSGDLDQYEGLRPIIDAMPGLVAVLNECRQVVMANKAMLEVLGDGDPAQLLGLRPGEIVDCRHAREMAAGCGTAEACSSCGAVAAIMAAQVGRAKTNVCHISQTTGLALDLRVTATPFRFEDRGLAIFAVQDISDENRRRVLERAFFHDILNTAGAVQNLANVLGTDPTPEDVEEFAPLLEHSAEQLVEEINAQRDLLAAESGDLVVHYEKVASRELVGEVASLYANHPAGKNRQVTVASDTVDVVLTSSPAFLRRILGNLVKNALEASPAGGEVIVGCVRGDSGLEFRVWNAGVMPRDVQLQLFKRSFSTKGAGRGVGTYSVKLLVEGYLGGQVDFVSTEDEGTVFTVGLPLIAESA